MVSLQHSREERIVEKVRKCRRNTGDVMAAFFNVKLTNSTAIVVFEPCVFCLQLGEELGMMMVTTSGCSTTESASICSNQKVFWQQRKKIQSTRQPYFIPMLQHEIGDAETRKDENRVHDEDSGSLEGGIRVDQLLSLDPDHYSETCVPVLCLRTPNIARVRTTCVYDEQ
ncbi:hypothetical protein GQ457_18G019950 [Hibiscus cannabinus]